MRLDIQSSYVIQKYNTIIELQYLKLIFKNSKVFISIQEAITLVLKGPVYLLKKDEQIKFEIYINQILKELELPFFKRYIEEKGDIIWIDDRAQYHSSKTIMKQY